MKRRRRSKSPHKSAKRRANPTVPILLANPRRRPRRRKRRSNGKKPRQLTLRVPRRHTHWGAVSSHKRRVNPTKRLRRRRRSNPSQFAITNVQPTKASMGRLLGMAAAGAAGIIFVRVVGNGYNKYLSSYVLGDEGRADPSSWRAWLDDVARVVVMEAAVIIVGRAARKMGKPELAQAFVIGGTAEVGRTAIGTLVRRLSPSTSRATYGLDGPRGVEAFEDEGGQVWQLNPAGTDYVPLGEPLMYDQFDGPELVSEFE